VNYQEGSGGGEGVPRPARHPPAAPGRRARPAATIRRDGTDWTIQPARATASPLWISADNAWTLTVGFGRASARVELGYSSRTAADRELEELEAICRAVVAGRLVERRRGQDGSRWRLTLGDGSVLHGSANWLLPVLPWVWVDEERFAAYADPPGQSEHPTGAIH
jgi:hypothetical protein